MPEAFDFGAAISSEMQRLKLSVRDIARRLALPRQTIEYWTRDGGMPSLPVLRMLVNDIGFNPYRLLGLKKPR